MSLINIAQCSNCRTHHVLLLYSATLKRVPTLCQVLCQVQRVWTKISACHEGLLSQGGRLTCTQVEAACWSRCCDRHVNSVLLELVGGGENYLGNEERFREALPPEKCIGGDQLNFHCRH